MEIEFIQVEGSSQVIEYGYYKPEGNLVVNFKKTGFYCYYNIAEEDFKNLKHAESIGKGIKIAVLNKVFKQIQEDKHFKRK